MHVHVRVTVSLHFFTYAKIALTAQNISLILREREKKKTQVSSECLQFSF